VIDEKVVAGFSLMFLLLVGPCYLLILNGRRPFRVGPDQTDRQTVIIGLAYLVLGLSSLFGSLIAYGITVLTGDTPGSFLAVCGGVLAGLAVLAWSGCKALRLLPRHTAEAAAARARHQALADPASPTPPP